MKLQTKYFGTIDYTDDELLSFSDGLYGFEEEKSFLLLPFSDENTLFSLQSVRTPGLAFTLMHPFSFRPSYAPVLRSEELDKLGVEKSEDLYYYVLCTVREPVRESTVNMKCPLAVNPDTRFGMQVILEGDEWGMRVQLGTPEEQGGAPC